MAEELWHRLQLSREFQYAGKARERCHTIGQCSSPAGGNQNGVCSVGRTSARLTRKEKFRGQAEKK